MAKFKDSNATVDGATVVQDGAPDVADRSIGSIIAETRNLTADQVEKVLAHQKAKGIRFGEAAIQSFYQGVSDAIDIPIMVQDAPAAGTPLSVPFLAKVANEIEQVSYFKMETAGAANKLRELIALGGEAIEGPWDGEEAITLLADLEAGATGAMTGGGFADGIRPIIEAHRAGDKDKAFAEYQHWLPLINHENRQAGFLAAKALMKEGGVIACEAPRSPWPPMHPEVRRQLIDIARRLDPLVLRWGR